MAHFNFVISQNAKWGHAGTGKYSFTKKALAGPMAWNSLPDFIPDPTSSTDCFRRLLNSYLFARNYCIQRISGS